MREKVTPAPVEGAVCPVPLPQDEQIVLGHGGGGRLMHDLIENVFRPPWDNPILRVGGDAAVADAGPGLRLAISTDSHVVAPLFFPGGDIGSLAVCGSVNDVAMMGARPRYLTAGFILEEGLPLETLHRVVASMQAAARRAGVSIVAGDTKVVERGKADGLYINTTGVGVVRPGLDIGPHQARPGDLVVLSGTMGDHGIAVLSARGDLGFEAQIESDVAPLNHLVEIMLEASDEIHVLRDPTRGGVASALHEIANASRVSITLEESRLPVRSAVRSACELLGFDPLYVANEGKLLAIVGAESAERVLAALQEDPLGAEAEIIGEVGSEPAGRVLMRTPLGTTRIVDVLMGEMLPRIC